MNVLVVCPSLMYQLYVLIVCARCVYYLVCTSCIYYLYVLGLYKLYVIVVCIYKLLILAMY